MEDINRKNNKEEDLSVNDDSLDENYFHLESLSDEELSEKLEEAKKYLSGEEYKPKSPSPQTQSKPKRKISKADLIALQKEALERSKKSEDLMRKQNIIPSNKNHLTSNTPSVRKPQIPNKNNVVKPSDIKNLNNNNTQGKNFNSQKMRGKKVSLAQIVLEEQARRRMQEQSGFSRKERSWQQIILILSIIFILLGGGLMAYFAFFSNDSNNNVVQPDKNKSYLITPNSEIRISTEISNEEVLKTFKNILTTTAPGQKIIQSLAFVKQEKPQKIENTVDEIFEIFSLNPPGILLRSISDDKYMVGLYSGENNSGFIVLSVSSFENALAGMLSWEKGDLSELSKILSTRQVYPEEKSVRWIDRPVKNIDSRILIDSSEDVFLIYSFLDKNTLVIAPDLDTFSEIADRYNTPEKVLR